MKYKLRYKSRENNIYLVGLMGTGKSTIGKILASRLKMDFIDSDQTIEKITGNSISQLFNRKGEEHFRSLEKKFIKDGHPEKNCIISCGGGLCIPAGAMESLKEKGLVICLWAEPETLLNRTKDDKSRPLLQVAKPIEALKKLLTSRESRYKEADVIILTDKISPEQVVEKIIEELDKFAT